MGPMTLEAYSVSAHLVYPRLMPLKNKAFCLIKLQKATDPCVCVTPQEGRR